MLLLNRSNAGEGGPCRPRGQRCLEKELSLGTRRGEREGSSREDVKKIQ